MSFERQFECRRPSFESVVDENKGEEDIAVRSTTNRITITITHDYNGSHEDMTCMTNTSRSRGTNEHPTNEYPNTGREY